LRCTPRGGTDPIPIAAPSVAFTRSSAAAVRIAADAKVMVRLARVRHSQRRSTRWPNARHQGRSAAWPLRLLLQCSRPQPVRCLDAAVGGHLSAVRRYTHCNLRNKSAHIFWFLLKVINETLCVKVPFPPGKTGPNFKLLNTEYSVDWAHPVLKYRVPSPHGSQPRHGGLQIPRWLGSDPLSAWWLGLAPATLEFWVRFPNERNQCRDSRLADLRWRENHIC